MIPAGEAAEAGEIIKFLVGDQTGEGSVVGPDGVVVELAGGTVSGQADGQADLTGRSVLSPVPISPADGEIVFKDGTSIGSVDNENAGVYISTNCYLLGKVKNGRYRNMLNNVARIELID